MSDDLSTLARATHRAWQSGIVTGFLSGAVLMLVIWRPWA